MKNILFVHYDLHFYRIPIYNILSVELKKYDINLIIWPEKILQDKDKIEFNYIENDFTFREYKQILKKYNIKKVINFLQPRSPSFLFYLQLIMYTYFKNIDLIYYGHGLNLGTNSKISSLMYNSLHLLYKKIILYTPNEKKYLWNIHQKKIEIAYNTLDLDNRNLLIKDTKKNLRKKYKLKDEFVILFSGRIEKRKNLELLLKFIAENKKEKIKLFVVGPTKDKNLINAMNKDKNIEYLGPIYDIKKMAEIFFIADVFSIPGHIGLGLVEALYWGLPIITLDVKHAPEIYYLEHKNNGFILKDKSDFKSILLELSKNKNLVSKLSENAKSTYRNNASVSKMIEGFTQGVTYDS